MHMNAGQVAIERRTCLSTLMKPTDLLLFLTTAIPTLPVQALEMDEDGPSGRYRSTTEENIVADEGVGDFLASEEALLL